MCVVDSESRNVSICLHAFTRALVYHIVNLFWCGIIINYFPFPTFVFRFGARKCRENRLSVHFTRIFPGHKFKNYNRFPILCTHPQAFFAENRPENVSKSAELFAQHGPEIWLALETKYPGKTATFVRVGDMIADRASKSATPLRFASCTLSAGCVYPCV